MKRFCLLAISSHVTDWLSRLYNGYNAVVQPVTPVKRVGENSGEAGEGQGEERGRAISAVKKWESKVNEKTFRNSLKVRMKRVRFRIWSASFLIGTDLDPIRSLLGIQIFEVPVSRPVGNRILLPPLPNYKKSWAAVENTVVECVKFICKPRNISIHCMEWHVLRHCFAGYFFLQKTISWSLLKFFSSVSCFRTTVTTNVGTRRGTRKRDQKFESRIGFYDTALCHESRTKLSRAGLKVLRK